jgi:CYTH domain-containing protein
VIELLSREVSVAEYLACIEEIRANCSMFRPDIVHFPTNNNTLIHKLNSALPVANEDSAQLSAWFIGYSIGTNHTTKHNFNQTIQRRYSLCDSDINALTAQFNIYSLRTQCYSIRVALLAGILDCLAHYNAQRHAALLTLDKSDMHSRDIIFLAKSVGLKAWLETSNNLLIQGNLVQLNSQLKSFQFPSNPFTVSNSTYNQFSFTIVPASRGRYYGFTVSGVNERFLLADYTVTHNTTAAVSLTERFQNSGFKVLRVPEAANLLLSNAAVNFALLDLEQQYQFQLTLVKCMIALEDSFMEIAKLYNHKCIILHDRGTMDARSYMPQEDWDRLCRDLNTTTLALRDNRYDVVVHLVTAAQGAEKFYTIEGHASRSEPPAFARELDERIKSNWIGFPYYHVVDNRTDFNSKINRVMSMICKFVGVQSVTSTKRKFLVKSINFPSNLSVQQFDVDHDYLIHIDNNNTESRVRRRGQQGQYNYTYTIRYSSIHGQKLELKRTLTRREYSELLLQRDPNRLKIHKHRYCFLFNDQYYELDIYIEPHKGLKLLEFYVNKNESNEKDEVTNLPNFLEIEKEVTDDPNYSMYNLAYSDQPVIYKTSSSVSNSPIIAASTTTDIPHINLPK